MKRKLFSNKEGRRRDWGQCAAVLVVAFTFAVTGAAGWVASVSQPQALLVEPGAVLETGSAGAEETAALAGGSEAAVTLDEAAAQAAEAAEALSAAAPIEAESAAQPAAEAEPAPQPETAAEPAPEAAEEAAEQPAAPEAEAAPSGTQDTDSLLDEENSLTGVQDAADDSSPWQQMTPELAAEDPLAARYEATSLANIVPDENGRIALTPEELNSLLDEQCIDVGEENCLSWLFNWLFGWLFPSEDPAPEPVYSGWRSEGGKTYYYDPSTNQPLTGLHTIDDKIYYFDASGVMQENVTFGIDVSRYQQSVDWNKVKAAGASYAIIRLGYRGYETGALVQDSMFESHYAGAKAAGLKVGVYAFSQAVNADEAREEAFACLYVLNGRALDYPIYFDSEYGTSSHTGRADNLSKAERTACAVAFCEEITQNSSYRAGVYASSSWFRNHLELSALSGYSLWNAHYGVSAPGIACDMWQGSCTGKLSGVNSAVDLNVSYIG